MRSSSASASFHRSRPSSRCPPRFGHNRSASASSTAGGGVAPTTAIEKVPPPPPVVPPHRNGFEQSLDPNAFLAALTPKLLDYVEGQADTAEPTVKFPGPREIGEAFEAAGCPLPIGEEAVEANDIMRACDRIMEYSVRTSSPLFNNQLYGAADPVAVAGDFMVAALNPSAYTYEVAPVFSLMETELIVKIGSILGGDYANRNVVDGLFVPGGSISNPLRAADRAPQRLPRSQDGRQQRGRAALRFRCVIHCRFFA